MSYKVRRAGEQVQFSDVWEEGAWKNAEVLRVSCFRKEGTGHRPDTRCKMLYDDAGIYGFFNVNDRYVRCLSTQFQAGCCRDSCVEFFVWPEGGNGYLNFEFNCGGNLLVCHIWNLEGRRQRDPLTEKDVAGMEIFTTMPSVVDPEITDEINWKLGFYVPFELFRKTTGMTTGDVSSRRWQANFYKCGDDTSHPHWASWQPIRELNFHAPDDFGIITFE
ncbi:carbohydrate-binding family 9-like protein [Lentisphaerota bacterium ZTH]|nr:carbohydrate-binding family 9-like protein [Lentisphaerota bacterium]WET05992.1 carbohydrate-binding family 9-like protein [Lentisphaerota bacterium ZTH]